MIKLNTKFYISTALILILVVTLGNQAFAQVTPNYAYFLDYLTPSNVSITPAGYAVIGEANLTQRQTWTDILASFLFPLKGLRRQVTAMLSGPKISKKTLHQRTSSMRA